jgi:glutamate dehydrogenase (NADP+)
MPSNLDAVEVFLHNKILYGPGKAANAGGVATSGLEMTQNAERLPWGRDEVDVRLRLIMTDIHNNCVRYGEREGGFVNYVDGANIAGFVKVSDAMSSQGIY